MKINDIVSKSIINEQFYGWGDIATAARSFLQNVGQAGMTPAELKRRITQDRGVGLAADGLLNWWKGVVYSLKQAYGGKNPVRDRGHLEEILDKKVYNSPAEGGIGASRSNDRVNTAFKHILDSGERLSSGSVKQAFVTIVTNAIAVNISPEIGVSTKPTKQDKQQAKLADHEYGGPIESTTLKPGDIVKIKKFRTMDDNRNPILMIKYQNRWYKDASPDDTPENFVILQSALGSATYQNYIESSFNEAYKQQQAGRLKPAIAFKTGLIYTDNPGTGYIIQTPTQHQIWLKSQKADSATDPQPAQAAGDPDDAAGTEV